MHWKNISFKFYSAQSHTTLYIKHNEHCKLNPSHFTLLKTAHFTFQTAHYIQHTSDSLYECPLHTAQCTLQNAHCTLHTENFKMHTARHTLYSWASCQDMRNPRPQCFCLPSSFYYLSQLSIIRPLLYFFSVFIRHPRQSGEGVKKTVFCTRWRLIFAVPFN